MPLMTVILGLFGSGQPRDRFEVVLNAAVHGWMEGHLAAPGHVISEDRSGIDMPAPPFPARESEQLRALVFEAMDRFEDRRGAGGGDVRRRDRVASRTTGGLALFWLCA